MKSTESNLVSKKETLIIRTRMTFIGRIAQFLRCWKVDILLAAFFLLLTALYAIFMVTDSVPLPGWVALGLLWMAHWWARGRLTVATPMNVPILGILALLPVSLYASTDWSLSLPKVYGILLGVAIFYAVVNAIHSIHRVQLAIVALILLGAAVAMLGLVGTEWAESKLFTIPQVYDHLPRLVKEVPRSITGGGIHFNIMGGALTFFIPLLASLLWAGREFKTLRFVMNTRLASILRVGYKSLLILSLVLVSFTLLLTQSRGSYLGVAVGLLALAVWHDRRFLWAIPLIALGFFVMVQVWGGGNLAEFVSRIDTTGGGTLPGRMEAWQRALYMIQDFPFTGVGIGTFGPVAQVLYPFFSTNATIPHAHNMLLTVAVDLGIPGLVLYAALLSSFAFSAWRVYREVTDKWLRALIMGLACGMLAHQVFGIMDAFMLGTKLGAVMWVFMGVAAALYTHRNQLARQSFAAVHLDEHSESNALDAEVDQQSLDARPAPNRSGNLLIGFGTWVLISLFAIAFVGANPYISLGIALVGGGCLGYTLTRRYESEDQAPRIEKPA